jgi:Ulp1 family protease
MPHTSNPVVCTIDRIDIKESDLDSLKNNNLLSDSIVEAYMKKMAIEKNVFILSYGMSSNIHRNGTTGSQTLRINLNNFDYIAGPVLLKLGEAKHWALMFVSLLNKEITYIDPFGATRSQCEDVRLNWTQFCKTRMGLNDKVWKISKDSFKHCIQSDTHSCGVFVCCFFELLINGQREYLTSHFDIAAYRTKIRKTITSQRQQRK